MEEKTKVLYILHDTNLGGATLSLIDMLKELRNYLIPIVLVPYEGPACVYLEKMGIKHYVFPFKASCRLIKEYNKNDNELNFYINYSIAREIVSVWKSEKWNIKLIHTNSSVNIIGSLLALMMNVPHVWHYRELLEEDFGMEFNDKNIQILLTKASDYIIAISECVKNKYERLFEKEIHKLYNGLDIQKYCVKNSDDIKGNNFYIAGSINDGKGQIDAIKAVDYLVHEEGYNDISLHLVGYGDERFIWIIKKFIKNRKLENNIFLYDFKESISDVQKKCSYSLTCSKMEALGRSTIEAMMARKLVIGANTGGTKELIGANEENGLLYYQGDYKSLAKKMIFAMRMNEKEYLDYLNKAQSYALKVFNNKKYAILLGIPCLFH